MAPKRGGAKPTGAEAHRVTTRTGRKYPERYSSPTAVNQENPERTPATAAEDPPAQTSNRKRTENSTKIGKDDEEHEEPGNAR